MWLATAPFIFGAATAASAAAPYTPRSDDEVLERIAVPRLPGTASLAELRGLWAAQPQFLPAALNYARAALELNRREEDPRYLGYAEAALAPWWPRPNAPPEVQLLRAALRLARMEVPAAEADFASLIASPTPEGHAARINRAALRLSRGEAAAAEQDCIAAAPYVSALVSATCRAAVLGLGPQAGQAVPLLLAALKANVGAPLASRVRAESLLAELAARRGDAATARQYFNSAEQALSEAGIVDPGLLAAYADWLLERGEAKAVQTLLAPLQRLDSLLLRLTLAEQQLGKAGNTEAASASREHGERLAQRFSEMRQREDLTHFREQALFELAVIRQPAVALATIQRSWATLREPIDARIYLQAAVESGAPAAAAPVQQWLQQTGLQDVRLKPWLSVAAGAKP